MRRAVVALVLLGLAGCGDGHTRTTTTDPPRGKAVEETESRARRRIDESKLSPRLKQELKEAQDLLDKAPKD